MKKVFALICIISVLLTLSACRKSEIETSTFTYVQKGEEIFTEGTAADNETSTIRETNASNADKNNIGADTDADFGLTEEELKYKPSSLTVTFYNSQKSIYGFTFNTTEQPIKPMIQIKKKGAALWNEYVFKSEKMMYFNSDWAMQYYYVSKAEVKLDPNNTYVYRICDAGAEKKFGKYIGTAEVTFTTKNPATNSFTFAHVSDTQRGPGQFASVLSKVTDKIDFLLHTGDIIQNPIESDWKEMIDNNFQYLSRIPMMAVAGNHEVNKVKNYDNFKHFNNEIPKQHSTISGYFYSFVYSNAKFIILNTNDLTGNQLTTEQYDWLVNELKSNDTKWKIVALHNPLYGVGEWGSTNNTIALALQDQLKGLFAQNKVDLVLQGHDHTIARSYPINENGAPEQESFETVNGVAYSKDPKGVIYLTDGTGGNVTREPADYDKTLYEYAAASKEASWSEISIDGDTLTVLVKYYDGGKESIYYKWGIKKSK